MDQAGLGLADILPPLPAECQDNRHATTTPGLKAAMSTVFTFFSLMATTRVQVSTTLLWTCTPRYEPCQELKSPQWMRETSSEQSMMFNSPSRVPGRNGAVPQVACFLFYWRSGSSGPVKEPVDQAHLDASLYPQHQASKGGFALLLTCLSLHCSSLVILPLELSLSSS